MTPDAERFWEQVRWRKRAQAITTRELAALLTRETGEAWTTRRVQRVAEEAIRERWWPGVVCCACTGKHKGYYVAESGRDIEHEINSLRSRMEALELHILGLRRKAVTCGWQETAQGTWYKPKAVGLFDTVGVDGSLV